MPGKMMMYREGGKVKKKAGPAMPPIGDTIASANRVARQEADEMRAMRMIDEGPMSPVDMQAMRMYGKKRK